MNSRIVWSDQVPEKDGEKFAINDIAFSPDGKRVIAAAGTRVLFYNAENGDLIESLRGHKSTVNCVGYCFDGRFASGGNDSTVVIWKSTGQGFLKYTHQSPIQKVAYHPTLLKLASCSDNDYGIWTPDQKQVVKEKLPSKILSIAWNLDGTLLALGLQSGTISIRNSQSQEVQTIERKGPVWCLTFTPIVGNFGKGSQIHQKSGGAGDTDMLIVGSWDKALSIYRLQGSNHKLHSEKPLKYYPCSIALAGSNYMLVSGSHKKATLYSRDGLRLYDISSKAAWVWGVCCHPSTDRIALGTDTGGIETIQMSFPAVHSLYRGRYAYRENLTEVIVQNLSVDRKVRIKCKDVVQRLSLYKNKLAVQLTDRVCVYESSVEEAMDMHFRLRRERIAIAVPSGPKGNDSGGIYSVCDYMAVTGAHLVFCKEKCIELYSFDGYRQRVWMMDSEVRYMKVEGGPEGKEALLVGLENGFCYKVFVDNPFPVEVGRRGSAIVGADMSLHRTKLATVDSAGVLQVNDLKSQTTLYSAASVSSACFNTEVDDMLCYSGDNSIFVVSGVGFKGNGSSQPLPQEQYLSGLAIGFQGQKIHCLYRGGFLGVDVPQGMNMTRALDARDYQGAYSIACLGATEAEWRLLAMRALRANMLTIAKNAFARLKEVKFLSLIEAIEKNAGVGAKAGESKESAGTTFTVGTGGDKRNRHRSAAPNQSAMSIAAASMGNNETVMPLDATWLAEILAYDGHHHEAAKTYARAGKIDEAIRLFIDLRRWDDAKIFSQSAGRNDTAALTMRQAKWLQEVNDWKGAAELLVTLGQYQQAAKTVVDAQGYGWPNVLIDVVRATPSDNTEILQFCGDQLAAADEDAFAQETYKKVGEVTKLMSLYARKQRWVEAAALAEQHEGEFDVSVFLPYAEWLVTRDRFQEALEAYTRAGRRDLSRKVLMELTTNAVLECRFKDAAYYYWVLAKDYEEDSSESAMMQMQHECEHKADLYFAYSTIHAFITDPFTSHQPETLFQVSRFIVNSLGNAEVIPAGISKAATLYTLAREAMHLGCFKLARHAYDRLGKLRLAGKKQDEVELDTLIVQAKPVRDDPDHLPVCYRCGATNPLLNPFSNKFSKGDVCTSCGHPFVRSFINFDILPLVEFVPEPSISDEEAIELIRQTSTDGRRAPVDRESNWRESKIGDGEGKGETLTFHGTSSYEDDYTISNLAAGITGDGDLFNHFLNLTLEKQASQYIPVSVDANALLSMKRAEVFVCKPSSKSKRATFYRNMLPDISIAISQPCHRFFHLEDFEFAYLSQKYCPYSRLKSVGEYGSL